MINFEKIKYKNFLSVGNHPVELALNSHKITLLTGPNGAAKSSTHSALSFALFGKSDRGNKGSLVNSINKRELEVRIDFSKGTDKYAVIRGIKPNIFEIYKNGVLVNQDASSRDYQKYLETEILGINYKSFYQTIVLSQSSFTPFMRLPAQERRAVVEDLLGISIFSKMKIILKSRFDQNKNDLADAEHEIRLKKEKLIQHREYLVLLEQNSKKQKDEIKDQIATKRKEQRELNERITIFMTELDTLHEQKSSNDTSLNEQQKSFDEAKTNTRLWAKELEDKKKFLSENNGHCPVCEQTIDSIQKAKQEEKLKSRQKELEKWIATLQMMKEALDTQKKLHQKTIDKFFSRELETRDLQKQVQFIESQIQEMEKNLDDIKVPEFKESEQDIYQSIIESEEIRNNLQEEKQYLLVCQEMLKDTGIKARMISTHLPIINRLLNKYLGILDFFVDFHFDSDFNEIIRSRYRDSFTYENFSEGEKARLNLAILFTWRQISQIKNSTYCNLLFLDEVFQSALDSNGSERLIDILGDNTETNDKTNVFIISHSPDVIQQLETKDGMVRHLVAKKYKNFSMIDEVSKDV